MANKKQVALLKRGVEAWNNWRQKSYHAQIDLSDSKLSSADLRNVNLSRAYFSRADLSHAKLSSADLSHSYFSDTNLSCADLSGAMLNNANFSDTNLSRADLSGAILNNANFSKTNLSEANLNHATLHRTKLSFADLSRSDLHSTDLSKVNFSSTNFHGADLSRVKLNDADLSDADLSDAHLSHADLSDANLSGANLRHANISRANLSGANLSGANLRHAIISDETKIDTKWKLVHELVNKGGQGRNLSGVDLSLADLSGVDLSLADLSGVDLSLADLSGANLRHAIISDETKIDAKWKLVHELVNEGGQGRNLSGADLNHIDLNHANFSGADLSKANLSKANLSKANLSKANLSRANLSGADLCRANLRHAIISDETKIDAKWKLVHELVNKGGQGRNLSSADLNHTDLNYANLSGANLSGANLSGADLNHAELSGANLSGANLSHAYLILSQAVNARFLNTDLTGTCISDWHINRETNFSGVKCNYIYRGYDTEQNKFTHRLPVNPDQFFKPGEFEEWIRISAEAQQTIDLTFTEGIDWQAFFQSLQGVRQEYPDAKVGLQAIERKGSAFVIRLETSTDANQGEIESLTIELYDTKLQLREAQGEIRVLREMSDVLKQLAGEAMNKPINKTTINTQTIGVQHSGSGNITDFSQLIGNDTKQTPAESAKEIQDLLIHLQSTNPTDIQAVIEEQVRSDPSLRCRINNALKEGGLETMKVIFPLIGIAIETVRGWVEA